MKIISCIFLVLITTPTFAASRYAGNLEIGRVRVHQSAAYFNVSPQPVETCSAWGEYFKFDHRTDTGKAFLSLLFTAKSSKAKIQIWYTESTAPGTDQSSGCGDTNMSIVTGLALQ